MSENQERAPENQTYLLSDDSGTEIEYELVFRDMLRGTEYGVLAPVDEEAEPVLCIVLITWNEDSESEDVSPIDDDTIIEEVFADFLEAFPEINETDEEME